MYRDVVQLKRDSAFSKATFLGVGPMSLNCVNAAIELANEHHIPLILIASRRQVDSAQFGGGYVNHWTTEAFCHYVKSLDKNGNIWLARDHGGPWQSELEVKQQMNLHQAMLSAKESYRVDIASGMNIIHIDPGRSPTGEANTSIAEFIERTKDLIVFCYEEAARLGKAISIEIGTDEGIVGSATVDETEAMLLTILDFCKTEGLRQPTFMVVQTGTKVMEMRNIGTLDGIICRQPDAQHHRDLLKLISLCNQHKLLLKEHNADYLSNEALSWHPQIGIDSANVAPEFGVIETKAFLNILKENQLHHLYERTIELAFNSGKWKKWMVHNTMATDYERAVIAGHYVFATDTFNEIKKEAQLICERSGVHLDTMLKNAVKTGLYRYLYGFGLVNYQSQLDWQQTVPKSIQETLVC